MAGALPSEGSGSTAGFWRTAYAEHGTAVFAFLCSRLRRHEDAEDLLHETFVRAIRAGDALREAGKVRSYLLSIAHRQLLNHHRRRREPLFSEQGEAFSEELAERPDPRPVTTDGPASERELATHLAAEIEALPAALREAFALGALQKLPYAEIAARTGWSLSLVKVNVYRARKRLIAGLARVVPELGRVS
ncbi:MAG TPA: RNA polymerase sigma factor [Thermoanaerobaculaceae bacterium]|nr:RNA polymerase sigma factor [Thermoanaerobaculaceae bacterium]HPS78214.1 RNA polymerase sigma factor [Thermoanaerobaculaceae bacterium]